MTNPTYGPWPTGVITSYTSGGARLARAADGTLVTPDCLCPDLLELANLGPADSWRGRMVRGVFLLLRLWPPRRTTT